MNWLFGAESGFVIAAMYGYEATSKWIILSPPPNMPVVIEMTVCL
jgi:hypothetical protein